MFAMNLSYPLAMRDYRDHCKFFSKVNGSSFRKSYHMFCIQNATKKEMEENAHAGCDGFSLKVKQDIKLSIDSIYNKKIRAANGPVFSFTLECKINERVAYLDFYFANLRKYTDWKMRKYLEQLCTSFIAEYDQNNNNEILHT